ncbi:putative palmitoyltransferase ZDHHC24, partial [Stegodyphus mimosarum]
MVILKDTTTRKIILPSLLKPGWHFCYVCEANSPPRSFHCDKCKTCILKRDHHCAFAGRCIGLKNFRYFLLFLFYLSLGAMYAMLFNMYFIWDVLGGFSFFSVGAHFVPFIFWILGYLSFRVFICTLMSLLSIIGVLCVTYFFFFHLNQMLHNQTTYEHIENIRDYDLGWKNNLVESLGQQWHMVWFLPFVESPLPSDGLSFLSNNSTASDLLNYNVAGSIRHRHL